MYKKNRDIIQQRGKNIRQFTPLCFIVNKFMGSIYEFLKNILYLE